MFDRAARYLLRQYAEGLLGWLLGLAPRAFRFVGWLDTRVGTAGSAERTADTLARLRGRHGVWAGLERGTQGVGHARITVAEGS